VFNILQADRIGCHIITVTPDLLAKGRSLGKDLEEFSLDTVKMFYADATKSGYTI
jgi:transaldolase